MTEETCPRAEPASPFEFTGGHLCLDFVNTVNGRDREQIEDLLPSYRSFLLWSKAAGSISAQQFEILRDLSRSSSEEADSVHRQTIDFRESLYSLLVAIAEEKSVTPRMLALVNTQARAAATHSEIQQEDGSFHQKFPTSPLDLRFPLWCVVKAATDLLLSGELAHLKQCASGTCAWLFLDQTKNHRRRWCEMKTCGNRDKARRYYARSRGLPRHP